MRVTNSVLLRGYNRNLNRLTTSKNNVEKKITTTRKFSRASESPLSAAKALNVRKSLYYSAQWQENLKVANKFYTEAETSLLQVSEKMAQVREELIAACNTTKDNEEYAIYGQNLSTIAEELVSIFNTDSAGRSIFGGESDETVPFTILYDTDGFPLTLCYHDIPVNSMADPKQFPYSNAVTIDVGLGMKIDEDTRLADKQSVLDISFNGVKITGCGSEKSTADLDLTSIKEGRIYRIDVYAGDIKKTIEFVGRKTMSENVDNINALLERAYSKEVAYDKIKQPMIDRQGVIYSEGSIVTVVNNTYGGTSPEIYTNARDADDNLLYDVQTGKYLYSVDVSTIKNRAETVNITNDSGYTDKFRLNFAAFSENTTYSIDVTRGDVTKSIEFTTPPMPTPFNRTAWERDIINELQDKLNDAFGFTTETYEKYADPLDPTSTHTTETVKIPMVAVSTNPVNWGTLSGEGIKVSASDSMKTNSTAVEGAKVASTHYDTIDLLKLNNNTQYVAVIDGTEVTFMGHSTLQDTLDALQASVDVVFGTHAEPGNPYASNYKVSEPLGDNKSVSITNTQAVPPTYATIAEKKPAPTGKIAVTPTKGADYQVDLNTLTDGKTYSIKVVYHNKTKIVEFNGGPTAADSRSSLQGALAEAFGVTGIQQNVVVDDDGFITTYDRSYVAATTVYSGSSKDPEVVSRDKIYSNNYIQLTIDAARALRSGDIDYANGCIDRIVKANENLLVQIADLGCNEDFIDFNLERLTTRDLNLDERQDELESTDLEYETMLLKQYDALYNMCLQMASMTIPNSIFNYLK